MNAESVLLRRVIEEVGDPWFREAYEGFNDGCVFCGSQDTRFARYESGVAVVTYAHLHKPTCLWFDIHTHLGLVVDPSHEQFDGTGAA